MVLGQDRTSRKSNGIHYTPEKLADFLARRLWKNAGSDFPHNHPPLNILDPACGNGALLAAIARQIPDRPIVVTGFETDPAAAGQATRQLDSYSNCQTQIVNQDFLEFACNRPQPMFDLVITNPPYVRTQVLGQRQSRRLASKFDLQGRVDLYQAFLAAISKLLKQAGWIAALTSNRFLYVQAGRSTRRRLHTEYDITELYDLGDTRWFDAAVLPAVMVARKGPRKGTGKRVKTPFVRVTRSAQKQDTEHDDLLETIEKAHLHPNAIPHVNGVAIESGWLHVDHERQLWRLASVESQAWLDQVSIRQQMTIGEVAEVKVGIKTTADNIFIRDNWERLPSSQQPEPDLLRPLLTHKVARRWCAAASGFRVLYPYEYRSQRTPVDLSAFPRAKAYLQRHQKRLGGRKYLTDAGRKWYEIWVPHRATDWHQPKIVWPDISETPKFFLDHSGSVVNGDCYWIKLKPGQHSNLLYLILAVANSDFAIRYYDYCFQNRLYGRRRRFMTQYVSQLPLPNPDSEAGRRIGPKVQHLLATGSDQNSVLEREIEGLVHQAFGLDSSAAASARWP